MRTRAGTLCSSTGQWRPRRVHETIPRLDHERRVGFTMWNLALCIVAPVIFALGGGEWLLRVAVCCSLGVCVSFHVGTFLGGIDSVTRLQVQNGLPSGIAFWFYNTIAHIVPVVLLTLALRTSGLELTPADGLWAAVLHLGWGLGETRGTLLLDSIYADLWPWQWHLTWASAVVAEVYIAPLVAHHV